jgi:hypothetical protein
VAPALEPIKFAIVDGGVKLAGALSQLVPEGAPGVAAPAPDRRAATRVLRNESAAPGIAGLARGPAARNVVFVILLGIAVALAAVYHVRRLAHRPTEAYVTEPGSPDNMVVVFEGKGRKILSARDGRPPSAAAIERFRQQELAKGNEVKILGPSMVSVMAAKTEPAAASSNPGESP